MTGVQERLGVARFIGLQEPNGLVRQVYVAEVGKHGQVGIGCKAIGGHRDRGNSAG